MRVSLCKHLRIFWLDMQWGNKGYPYYFGTINEVINSGVEVRVIKQKVTSGSQLTEYGFTKMTFWCLAMVSLEMSSFTRLKGCLTFLTSKSACSTSHSIILMKVRFIKINNFSLTQSSTPRAREFQRLTGVETVLFPYGCDDKIFGVRSFNSRKYDMGFSGTSQHDPLLWRRVLLI